MADVTDMRGYIEALEAIRELRRLEGVYLNLEVGALTGAGRKRKARRCYSVSSTVIRQASESLTAGLAIGSDLRFFSLSNFLAAINGRRQNLGRLMVTLH